MFCIILFFVIINLNQILTWRVIQVYCSTTNNIIKNQNQIASRGDKYMYFLVILSI